MLPVSWKYVGVAMEAALRAGALQKERYGDPTLIVEHKGAIDLVTEVDRKCEQAILEVLRGHFPDHDFVTEETHIDRRSGRYVNSDLAEYHVPVNADIGSIDVTFVPEIPHTATGKILKTELRERYRDYALPTV